jgi:hypothetical protein
LRLAACILHHASALPRTAAQHAGQQRAVNCSPLASIGMWAAETERFIDDSEYDAA